jgi:hypothetical protein
MSKPSRKPRFPFRVITSWIHPSEIPMCEGCKTNAPTYAIENYIEMSRMIGETMWATLANDPWVRAIKAQAREQFEVAFTSHLCVSCLNGLHIVAFGDSPNWQKAVFLLTNKYGEIASASFILVNSYEDEGVSYWFLCPITESILDVADFVEQVKVEEHATKPTTREDIQGVISEVTQFAQRRGTIVKVIHQEDEH